MCALQFGEKSALVPYEACHVEPYHEWMKDEWIQGYEKNITHALCRVIAQGSFAGDSVSPTEMTASEPLSLEEELAMQKEWREDEKKCTFIVLDQSNRWAFRIPLGSLEGVLVESTS